MKATAGALSQLPILNTAVNSCPGFFFFFCFEVAVSLRNQNLGLWVFLKVHYWQGALSFGHWGGTRGPEAVCGILLQGSLWKNSGAGPPSCALASPSRQSPRQQPPTAPRVPLRGTRTMGGGGSCARATPLRLLQRLSGRIPALMKLEVPRMARPLVGERTTRKETKEVFVEVPPRRGASPQARWLAAPGLLALQKLVPAATIRHFVAFRHRHFGSCCLSASGLWVARFCAARFSRFGLSAPVALLLLPPELRRHPFLMATSVGNVADSTGTVACRAGTGAPGTSGAAALRRPGPAFAGDCPAACVPEAALSSALIGPSPGGVFQKPRPGRGGGSPRLCACPLPRLGRRLAVARVLVGAALGGAQRDYFLMRRSLIVCYIYPTVRWLH